MCLVKSTFFWEIKQDHFTTWLGLIVELSQKYFDLPHSTAQGHMRQKQQKFGSTKPHAPTFPDSLAALAPKTPYVIPNLKNQRNSALK